MVSSILEWSTFTGLSNVSFLSLDAPVVTCPTMRARLGQRSVRLRCEIRARPELSALFWIIDVNGTTVAEGTTIDDFWSASMVSPRCRIPLWHIYVHYVRECNSINSSNSVQYFVCWATNSATIFVVLNADAVAADNADVMHGARRV